jgi:hypothetical protein
VAFEIPLSRVEGKFKLNQNRAPEDRQAVMERLERSEDPEQRAVGVLMRLTAPTPTDPVPSPGPGTLADVRPPR